MRTMIIVQEVEVYGWLLSGIDYTLLLFFFTLVAFLTLVANKYRIAGIFRGYKFSRKCL